MKIHNSSNLKIFISYSTEDHKKAEEIQNFFIKKNFSCFLSGNSIKPSDRWRERIKNEIETSQIFIFLLSENFKTSKWCDQEAGMGIYKEKNENVLIFPVIIDDIDPYGFIEDYQCIKYNKEESLYPLLMEKIQSTFNYYLKKEDRILTNDYINLDEKYYFSGKELKEKNTIEADTNPDISDIFDTVMIHRIPNNLDSFNKNLKTYCYRNNPYLHKGIIMSRDTILNSSPMDSLVIIVIITNFKEKKIRVNLYKCPLFNYPEDETPYIINSIVSNVEDVKKQEIKEKLCNQYNYFRILQDVSSDKTKRNKELKRFNDKGMLEVIGGDENCLIELNNKDFINISNDSRTQKPRE